MKFGFSHVICRFVNIDGVGQAFDFGATDRSQMRLRIWFNDTAVLQAGNQPPPISRINKVGTQLGQMLHCSPVLEMPQMLMACMLMSETALMSMARCTQFSNI